MFKKLASFFGGGKASLPFSDDPASPQHWRNDPAIRDHFSQEGYPDDLAVLVHEGGYRKHNNTIKPEVIWVRTGGRYGDYFRGTLLNQPHKLPTRKQGESICFKIDTGTEFPVLVTENYIRQRTEWNVAPCDKCGFTELFDEPEELIRLTFPNMPKGGMTQVFTTFCNLCGGVQVVSHVSYSEDDD